MTERLGAEMIAGRVRLVENMAIPHLGKATLGKCPSSKPSLGDVMDVGKPGGLGLNRSRFIGSIECRVEWRGQCEPALPEGLLAILPQRLYYHSFYFHRFYKRIGERNWTFLTSPPFSIQRVLECWRHT